MKAEVITAIISVSGVIISVIISYLTSSRNVAVELKKHKEEQMQEFGRKLFEKRLEVYPILFSYVSNFIKVVRFDNLTQENLVELSDKLLDWDTKNSIYMSAKPQLLFHQFKLTIAELSKKTNEQLAEILASKEDEKNLKERGEEIELALKNELGIYSFESPNKVVPGLEFSTYFDADSYAAKQGE